MAYLLRLEIEEFHDSLIIALIRVNGHKQNLEKRWKAVKKPCSNDGQELAECKETHKPQTTTKTESSRPKNRCEVLKKIKAWQNAFNNCLNIVDEHLTKFY